MTDAPMTPEDYARFMGQVDEGEEAAAKPEKEQPGLPQAEIDKIRVHLKQAGVTSENIDTVTSGITTLSKGEQKEFNFIRGHIRRVRVRRELSGKVTMIPF